MPTYEYACNACGKHIEVSQSFSDPALTVCPSCGGSLRKVFGSIGIVLKGSGFYKTDSRASSNGKGKKSSSTETAVSGDAATVAGAKAASSGGETGGTSDGGSGTSATSPGATPSQPARATTASA